MKLPLRVRAVTWAAAFAAAGVEVYWLTHWKGTTSTSLFLAAVLVAFSAVAVQFQLVVSPRVKFNLAMAFYFASLLLFAPPVAIALVALSRFLGEGILAVRRNPLTGRPRRDIASLLFNNSLYSIAMAAAAFPLYAVVNHVPPAEAPLGVPLAVGLLLAAAVMYLVYSCGVALIAGVQLRTNPLAVWSSSRRRAWIPETVQYPLGAILAIASADYAMSAVLMVLPAVVIYLALRHTFRLQLVRQTVTAVEALADIVDMRDHYTFEHSRRVADFSVRIARELGLPPEQVETIRLAARVHDVGKIGVPDHILLKPGALSAEERKAVERHSRIGYQMLSGFPEYRHGAELVLHHHERWDGNGYPEGLAGSEIPLGAQVIAVADSVDAMTSDRSYRSALSLSETLAELERGKGTHWSPAVVSAFQVMAERDGERMVAAIEGVRLAGLDPADVAGDRRRGFQSELARKLELRPASLDSIDSDVATAILSSLERMDERIKQLGQEASLDELTGVLRRRAGVIALEREVNRAHRSLSGALVLAFIDVDGLKTVNDGLGHAAGDDLIRSVAQALRTALRSEDLVFRYGGDEFVCVLPESDLQGAQRRLQEIQQQIAAEHGREVFSVGLAALRDGESAEQLCARADGALYAERRLRRGDRLRGDNLVVLEGAAV